MELTSKLLAALLTVAVLSSTVSAEGKSKYSAIEKAAIEKLRPVVKDILYRDYMQEDRYLLPFLRAQEFNIDEANQMLRKAHKWRIDNKIDTILNEDMSQLDGYFPYYSDGIDNDGRPIISWAFGKWDIRRIALAGRMDDLNRYTDRMLEEGFVKVREQRNITGKDVTQYVIIIDGNGYGLRTHACVSCLPFYFNFITHADMYYPEAGKNIHMINIPRVVDALMSLIRPVMTERTRNALKLYGHNKNDWQKEFVKSIRLDQLRPQFGGTKPV